MAERERGDTAKREVEQRPQRDLGSAVGQSHRKEDNLAKDSGRGVKPGGTVGRDTPDESKEHHTEIAVEAGRAGRERHENKQ